MPKGSQHASRSRTVTSDHATQQKDEDLNVYLGGTSISALRVVSRIRKEFEVRLPLAVIFETPSLEAVVESVLSGLDQT